MRLLPISLITLACLCSGPVFSADFKDPNADRNALPQVPPGFEISVFAQEPLVQQPCSMAFDARGRLFIGMGPQYRKPTPETPGDRVVLVNDHDGDGIAETTQDFAIGFNAIQGLAWHGKDLWVANAPDLTIVRDLDGDDVADEYVRLYTDLGNLEHGLHGLVWAPDGKLYMSKGNSKGLTQPGRVAPKPFRDLWGVTAPPGTPDFPAPQTFTKESYQRTYHDPADDWGLDGGILRCDDHGLNLEIVSRGFRNPWDIAHDSGMNWIGTDNDQTSGDRVFMSFPGGHFGWNHPWSSHWSADEHPPTAPVSGPLFEGSGTGIIFGTSPQFPEEYRNVFLINDWLGKATYLWKPRWDGALMRSAGKWEPFIVGGQSLFRPTDMEFGPDGALWILGWGRGYGAEYENGELVSEGRVFRVRWKDASTLIDKAPRHQPLSEWTVSQLIQEFESPLPVRRIDAQDELVRRGPDVVNVLFRELSNGAISEATETWIAWTISRAEPASTEVTERFQQFLSVDSKVSMNLKIQAIRILSRRANESGDSSLVSNEIPSLIKHDNPRLRLETLVAIAENRIDQAREQILDLLAVETDRVVFYSAWKTLLLLYSSDDLRSHLGDPRGGTRRGVLLALLEGSSLTSEEVAVLENDDEAGVRSVVALWKEEAGQGITAPVIRGSAIDADPSATPVSLVNNLVVQSGRQYEVIPGGLKNGAKIFVDRKYRLQSVPEELVGADYIQTANDDDGATSSRFLSLELLHPARISVAIDERVNPLPSWIATQFQERNLIIDAGKWNYRVFSRDYESGHVELGGNTEDGRAGGKSNSIFLIEPLSLGEPQKPATLEDSLALLSTASAERGEVLFRHRQGAGCFQCHSLNSSKNGFGPNLGDIGKRATPKHLVESIINPSAVITEGFQLQQILTEEGKVFSGVLLNESGLSVTLGLTNGATVKISKKKIEERRSANISAMPTMAQVLGSQQVADLVAFLMRQSESADSRSSSTELKGPRLESLDRCGFHQCPWSNSH
ncbi:MAG TPA: PVC-type heme-binding CxxCH protein [Planctomicrobium sp.]|nr:PVC-type heme-binding CxxCH protein [Planctomicrobium sp.]